VTLIARWWRRAWLLSALIVLTGCASQRVLQKPLDGKDMHWQGRLAVTVFSKPVQAFTANFELQGRADQGELVLTSPLGTTLAQMQWTPDSATLIADGKPQHFDSLQALARTATGTDLPVAGLFAWLQGRAEESLGWQADLSELPDGRIVARHVEDVSAELKIILDR
jgi:outer membrane lipoprotein LolB